MAATVEIVEKNGTGGTATDKTSGTVRFKNADNATVDVNNPMVIPGSGTDWSYEKWLRLRASVAPSVQITNVKAYADGTNNFGAGVNVYAKAVAGTAYATPVEGSGTAGFADLFTYTAGSPLTVGGGTYTGTGEFADHVVMELSVGTNASQGSLAAETLTFSYDEI